MDDPQCNSTVNSENVRSIEHNGECYVSLQRNRLTSVNDRFVEGSEWSVRVNLTNMLWVLEDKPIQM